MAASLSPERARRGGGGGGVSSDLSALDSTTASLAVSTTTSASAPDVAGTADPSVVSAVGGSETASFSFCGLSD
jgi:hypothetical protein